MEVEVEAETGFTFKLGDLALLVGICWGGGGPYRLFAILREVEEEEFYIK